MPTYQIKAETADALRQAAPFLGLTPSPQRNVVAPGVEALHLPDAVAEKFEAYRKRSKVGADVAMTRIARKVVKNGSIADALKTAMTA